MRELEFLPDWYGVVRRRRTLVIVQAWGTAGLLVVLLIWTSISQFRAMGAQRDLSIVSGQLAKSQKDVDELTQLQVDKVAWSERGEVLGRIGLSVESTRLLGTIAQATPEKVALSSFSFQTDERAEVPRTASAARGMKDRAPLMDRKLKVRLTGMAPSDAEVWDLVTKLTQNTFFEDVQPTNSREADFEGRLVKEFEVTFTVDLNAPAGN